MFLAFLLLHSSYVVWALRSILHEIWKVEVSRSHIVFILGRSVWAPVLPPLMHLSLVYRLPWLPWGSSWAARPARLCLLLQLLCLPGTAHVSSMMARAGTSCWTPPSPKWEVWWCWESNADSQPSSGLQPQPPRFQFILSFPITSCYFHLPFLTTCPVDFMLQQQTQKGQPHIDCAAISHNCLRSKQIYVFISQWFCFSVEMLTDAGRYWKTDLPGHRICACFSFS